jgi:voltage-gated potassium channel
MSDAAADTPAGRARLRRVRGHVESRRSSHSYGWVLLLIGVSFVFAATAPNADWATSVLVLLQSATLVAALWTSGLARAGAWHNILLLALAVVLAIAGLVWTGPNIAAALGLVSALMTLTVAVVIALSVIKKGEITRQSITGAVCIYVLLGMIFMFVYGAVAALGDGPFFHQGTDGTRALRLYFSYITMTTVGYGDYTPAGNLGHALAVIEALTGQLYLVTVVALLVARVRPVRARVD